MRSIADYRKERGFTPRRIDEEEIVGALHLRAGQRGAQLLDEGIALRASDIDVVYLAGYGFPRYRGGPMFHADTVGLLTTWCVRSPGSPPRRTEDPGFWRPAPLLAKLAAEGKTFNG